MTIDDKTNVSFYTILAIIPFIISGIVWVSSIASMAQENKIIAGMQDKRQDAQRDNIKEQRALLVEIKERLIRIETRLSIKQ